MQNEKVINFDHKTKDDKRFNGTFVVKRVSIMDNARISKTKSFLLGGLPPMTRADDYQAEVIAHLQNVVMEAPEWWDLENLYSFEIADALYKEVKAFEDSFRIDSRRDNKESSGESEEKS